MSGHSMGGATAMKVGEIDPRVKCVLTHDPWVNVIQSELPDFDQLLSKYLQVTTSSQWRVETHLEDQFGLSFRSRFTD